MAFFTLVGIIVIAIILYKIFSNDDKPIITVRNTYTVEPPKTQPKLWPLQDRHNRSVSLNMLCKKNNCTVEKLQTIIMTKLDVKKRTDSEIRSMIISLLEEGQKEAEDVGINPDDTQQAIIAFWLHEYQTTGSIS